MAYDTELADRIRFLIGSGPGVTEKKMFGGLAFLIDGNMAISASGQGGVLVRVDPADTGALDATANATLAVMGGRTMQGWLRVSSEDLEADEQLIEWVKRTVGYARSLPPKRGHAQISHPAPGSSPATASIQPSRSDSARRAAGSADCSL